LPRVTTGNTMAPCVIIGERAAEILRSDHGLETAAVSRSPHVERPPMALDPRPLVGKTEPANR
jgi:choline dehydrogenase-like flavoprotein